MSSLPGITLSFHSLISAYRRLQDSLVKKVKALASKGCTATPGAFILLQFEMANVTQMGESLSNLIHQVTTIISNAIANQKTQ
jgi:hypothetical protein